MLEIRKGPDLPFGTGKTIPAGKLHSGDLFKGTTPLVMYCISVAYERGVVVAVPLGDLATGKVAEKDSQPSEFPTNWVVELCAFADEGERI
jgi:hypothetical protein